MCLVYKCLIKSYIHIISSNNGYSILFRLSNFIVPFHTESSIAAETLPGDSFFLTTKSRGLTNH